MPSGIHNGDRNGFKHLSPAKAFRIRSKGGRAADHSKAGKACNAQGHNKNKWTPAQARDFGRMAAALRRLGKD